MTTNEIQTATYIELAQRRLALTALIAPSDRRSPSTELGEINRRLVQIERARIAEQTR